MNSNQKGKGNLNLCHRCFLWKGNSNCRFAKWAKWNICDFLFAFFKAWVSSVSTSLRDADSSWSCFHCLLTLVGQSLLWEESWKNELRESLLCQPAWKSCWMVQAGQRFLCKFKCQWEGAQHRQPACWVFTSRKKQGISKKSCYILVVFWYSLLAVHNKWTLISSGYSGLC